LCDHIGNGLAFACARWPDENKVVAFGSGSHCSKL
jgi:hypothetical protein